MNRLRIHRKEPFYLGIILIGVGILLRWLIEQTLTSDGQIESQLYGTVIFVFQLLLIAVGIFLLIRQPAVRLPNKSELALVLFSALLTFFLL